MLAVEEGMIEADKEETKMKLGLTSALMVLTLTFVAGTGAQAGPAKGNLANTTTVVQTAKDGDPAFIVKEVRHELMMLPYYSRFDWMEFRVEDSTVILSGQVVRPTLKSDAGRVVEKIKGVDKVVNQIEVLPLSPMDDQIRLAEARAIFDFGGTLYRYGLQSTPSIHIIVKNGNVTLKGAVANKADSNMANIRANGVPNVFSVKNELQIENS
jgi:hyperosmotically inducible periplasmic protein